MGFLNLFIRITASYTNIATLVYAKSNALGVKYSAGFKAVYYPQ